MARAETSKRDRLGLIIVGPAAAAGLVLGAVVGFLVVSLVFEPTARGDDSLLLWFLENGMASLFVVLPLVFGGAGLGWLALPGLAGGLLGWSRTILGLAYQLVIGAVLLAPTVWGIDYLYSSAGDAASTSSWGLLVIWAVGVPTLSRYLALPGNPV